MSSEPGYAFQVAIFNRLNGHADLAGKVFDNVLENTAFPYVAIGDDQLDEWDTKDSNGAELEINIHTWTRGRGRAECKQLMNTIHQLLNRYDLDVDGHRTVTMYQDFSNTMIEPDGVTYHGIQRFRVLTEEG